jgi:hypothetical protein
MLISRHHYFATTYCLPIFITPFIDRFTLPRRFRSALPLARSVFGF